MQNKVIAQARFLRTAAATLSHVFVVGETSTDSSTTVTVVITDANGDAVQSGDAVSVGQGRYTFALTPQAQLTMLTVAWSATIAGAAVVETDFVEIVGARFFTLAQGRASDPTLNDLIKYPTAVLEDALLQTEQELEEICDRGFIPHYGREVLDGSGSHELVLSGHDIRTIRAVRVAPRVGQAFVALTAGELAALAVKQDSTLVRTDFATWTEGSNNVVVEYEYGLNALPADLLRAAKSRFRSWANVVRTAVPDRATSYATSDGKSYRMSQPGPFKVGIPWIDAAYGRYSLRDGAGGRSVAVSRPLNFDPQYYSLYHGFVR